MPLGACHLSALLLVGLHTLPPHCAFLVGVFLARAPFNQTVQVGFYDLAGCRRASEIAVQPRPDWLVYHTSSYCKLMFVPALFPVSAKVSSFSVWPVRTWPNRDAAPHSNFPKLYAPTSAEPKKAAAHNYASPLASYLTQMAVTTALSRAKTLDATSTPK